MPVSFQTKGKKGVDLDDMGGVGKLGGIRGE